MAAEGTSKSIENLDTEANESFKDNVIKWINPLRLRTWAKNIHASMFNMESHNLDNIGEGAVNKHFTVADQTAITNAAIAAGNAVQVGQRTVTHSADEPFIITAGKPNIVVEVEDDLVLDVEVGLQPGFYVIELRQDAIGHNITLLPVVWQHSGAYNFSSGANQIDVITCFYNGSKMILIDLVNDVQEVV